MRAGTATPGLLLLVGCATAPTTIAPATPAPPPTTATTATAAVPPRPVFPWSAPPESRTAPTAAGQVKADARAARPLVSTPSALRFLDAAEALPEVGARPLLRTRDKAKYYSAAEAQALPEAERAALEPFPTDDELYYFGRYGSPISYVRALDLLAEARLFPAAPPGNGDGARILDIGFGYIGHLRMLASLGYRVTGIDPDEMMRALYQDPSDVGAIAGFGGAPSGSLRLFAAFFARDREVTRAIGGGHRLIVAKNVLKKGYIHPDRPVDPKRQIQLGVDDATYLAALHDALDPGGALLLYNICPAPTPPDKPFVPWSDGRSPFTREQFRAAGFTVIELDRDDTPAIRDLGHALRWDVGEDAMDLKSDLSVLYTLVRRDG